jgi:HEAT repeat protein
MKTRNNIWSSNLDDNTNKKSIRSLSIKYKGRYMFIMKNTLNRAILTLIFAGIVLISGCINEESIDDMKTKKDVNNLIEKLDSYSRDDRIGASRALGEVGDKNATTSLVRALYDKDMEVRREAANALEKLNWTTENNAEYAYYLIIKERWDELINLGDTAIEPMIEFLKYEEVNDSLKRYLENKGEPAIKPLIQALKGNDENTRNAAAEILVKIGTPVVVPLVKVLREDNDSFSYRSSAIDVLNKVGWKPRTMSTGTRLGGNYNRGNGELTVENGLSWDAVVVLSKIDNQNNIISSIYINAGDSYTISNIPDGTDTLFFKLGKDFDDKTKEFTITTRYVKFEEPLKFEISTNLWGESFSNTYKVTLYEVVGGNAQTEDIDKNEFPKI